METIYQKFLAVEQRGREMDRRVTSRPTPHTMNQLAGLLVCVTGRFAYGKRDSVHAELRAAGARVTTRVSSACDVLVQGEHGSTHYVAGDTGRKHSEAARHGVPVVAERTIFV